MGRQQEKDHDLRLLREARDSVHMTPLQMRRVEEKIRVKRAAKKVTWKNPFGLSGYISVLKGGAVAIGMIVLASTVAFGAGSLDGKNVFVSDSAAPIEIQTDCGSAIRTELPETTTTTETTTQSTTTTTSTTTNTTTTTTAATSAETESVSAYTASETDWTSASSTDTMHLQETTAPLTVTTLHVTSQSAAKTTTSATSASSATTTATTTSTVTSVTVPISSVSATKPVSGTSVTTVSSTASQTENGISAAEAGIAVQTEPTQPAETASTDTVHLVIPAVTARPGEDVTIYAYFDEDISFRKVSFTIAQWDLGAKKNVALTADADLLEAKTLLGGTDAKTSKVTRTDEALGINSVITVRLSLSTVSFTFEAIQPVDSAGSHVNAEIAAGVQIPLITVHIPEDAAIGTEYLLNTQSVTIVPSDDREPYTVVNTYDSAQFDLFSVEEFDAHALLSINKYTCAVDYGTITVVE